MFEPAPGPASDGGVPDGLEELVAGFLQFFRTGDERHKHAARAVSAMTFRSPPATHWRVVLEAVRQARDDVDLISVVAPLGRLVRRHGDRLLARVEEQAGADPKFARALTGLFEFDVPAWAWPRVRQLQERVEDPL
jgi:hypothetical protein